MSCSTIIEYDFEIYQGDNLTKSFMYKAGEDETPVDISGYTIQFECSEETLTRDAVILDQTTDPGRFDINFIPSDTADLDIRRVKYEVVFYSTGLSGTKNTKFRGSLHMIKENVS